MYFRQTNLQERIARGNYTAASSQMGFHALAMKEIKNQLGKSCTYLSHVTEGGLIKFKANLIIKGEKKTLYINTEKANPSDLVPENYKDLKILLDEHITSKKAI